MPCRDVKTAVSSAGHVKKSVYLYSTGQGLGGAQCPMQVPTAAGTGGGSLRKSLETVLGELKEDGLHSLELRVLRKGGRPDHSL